MKTRLLKKLRKMAKEEYWLEDHRDSNHRYWVVSKICSKNCALHMYKNYEDAFYELTWRRRGFILDYIDEHRNYKLDI